MPEVSVFIFAYHMVADPENPEMVITGHESDLLIVGEYLGEVVCPWGFFISNPLIQVTSCCCILGEMISKKDHFWSFFSHFFKRPKVQFFDLCGNFSQFAL